MSFHHAFWFRLSGLFQGHGSWDECLQAWNFLIQLAILVTLIVIAIKL